MGGGERGGGVENFQKFIINYSINCHPLNFSKINAQFSPTRVNILLFSIFNAHTHANSENQLNKFSGQIEKEHELDVNE
jgi:hypothetical protein